MQKYPSRSLFWPLMLIGVGVIWLMSVLNIIPAANFSTLLAMWPLLLIVAGLHMLFGRRSQVVSVLLALFSLALVVVILIAGPALGLPSAGTLQTKNLVEPINDATSATVVLDLASQPVEISTVADSANLFEADLDYYGTLSFSATGNPHRFINLNTEVNGINLNFDTDPTSRWDIRLSPEIPLDLKIDGGSGSGDLDLSALNLEAFRLDVGSGSFNMSLPNSAQPYEATLIGGSGSLTVDLPAHTALTLNLDGGSGSLNLNLPEDTEARVEVRDSGSGSVNLPDALQWVSGEDKEGVWETSGYATANAPILIICTDLGSGSFNLR